MDEFGPMQNHRIDPKHGSFYISTELQDLQIQQVIKLLNHRNPYTGMRYADDPAVAYLEMYNEDSALFGGVTSVMARSATLRERTGRRFANWLEARYKTENAFMEAWGPRALNSSVVSNGKLPTDESWRAKRIYPAGNPWFFDPTNLDSTQRHIKRRLLDTMLFLYVTQNEVYARYQRAIRATGYSGELIASNWQAGRMMSHFYNLHSDALIGTIDRHNYFGGRTKGFVASRLNPPSMLDEPGSGTLSASMQQVDGLPFMLSEWIHVDNHPYAVEGPALIGAYGFGLQGWDAAFAFQSGDDGNFSDGRRKKRWDATAPNFLGVFPAVSRQILRGDVQESKSVHYRNVNVRSLDEGGVGFEDFSNQSGDVKTFSSGVFSSEALVLSKSVVRYTSSPEITVSRTPNGAGAPRNLQSETGELNWQRGSNGSMGLATIDTPNTKALIGYTKGQPVHFHGVSITSMSKFSTVYVSSLSEDSDQSVPRHFLVTLIGGGSRLPGRQHLTQLEGISVQLKFASHAEIQVYPLQADGRRVTSAVKKYRNEPLLLSSIEHASPYFEIFLME